ncbi:MAG: ROK family protein [Anaerolineae bacterium]|nr:ROK family protein [Anaerolineae bacterium]
MTSPVIACCDLGGTKMLVGLTTLDGELLASEKYILGGRVSPDDVLDDLDAALNRLLARVGRFRGDITALGFCTTGVMDVDAGLIYMNHNMGWAEVRLRELAMVRLGLPIVIEMDANAAALGEHWRGAAHGLEHFVYVIVGTGIGAGILLGRRIWRGARGAAGEVGHTVVLPGGPLCGCGKHGCLEALASGLAIQRKATAALKLGRATILESLEGDISAQAVADAARGGDSVARQIMDEAGYYLGLGLSNLVTLLDPQALVLGGGLGWGAFDVLEAPMRRAFDEHLNYWADRKMLLTRAALGEYAGLYGAARAALDLAPGHLQQEVRR